MAHDHWKSSDPARFAEIQNPQEFFSSLGQTVEFQIQDLQLQLAGPDPVNAEPSLEKVGRLNMARLQAEEVVLADLVWLSPPPEEETMESEDPSRRFLFDKVMWEAQNEDQEIY
jgi:hypothetical protein